MEGELTELVARYGTVLGTRSIVPIANLGYIVSQRPLAIPEVAPELLLLFDLDDTVLATTEGKRLRFRAYGEMLAEWGMSLTSAEVARLEQLTNQFAMWEEEVGGGNVFHLDAQIVILAWITEFFQDFIRKGNFQRVIDQLERHLGSAPVAERVARYQLLRQVELSHLPRIEEIFNQTIFSPPLYANLIAQLKMVGEHVPLAIFTYGDPRFQLRKAAELLQQVPELKVGEIWLTKVRKSLFFDAVLRHPDSGLAASSLIFAAIREKQRASTLIMIDDNIHELEGLAEFARSSLREAGRAELLLLHVRQPGAKGVDIPWKVDVPHASLDLQQQALHPRTLFGHWSHIVGVERLFQD